MVTSTIRQLADQALNSGDGVLRLAPNWVPRSFCVPGRRLRLHPDDLYALGGHRGGIDERWFASTVTANNGPDAPEDEGLSAIYLDENTSVTLRDVLDEMGAVFLGQDVIDRYGGWVMFAKFFDNMDPLPHHLHQTDEKAADTGQFGKPEAYFFPAQYNFTLNTFPYTFFGLAPSATPEQVIDCLKNWGDGDNQILALSQAYRLQLDTGWYIPPAVLHAPGSLCTYEPQRASDVFSMWQSLIADRQVVDRAMLVRDVPEDKHYDYDYLLSLLDWDMNVNPNFREDHFLTPRVAGDRAATEADGYLDEWIVYGSEWFSAKRLTVYPGRTVSISDPVAYGLICVQGHGRFGQYPIAAPTLIRFGQMTEDEFFVTIGAARSGVQITNASTTEPLVMMKHFNPGHPQMPDR